MSTHVFGGKKINTKKNGIVYTQTPEMQEALKWPGTSEIKNNYLALPVSHCLLYPFYERVSRHRKPRVFAPPVLEDVFNQHGIAIGDASLAGFNLCRF